MKRKILSSAILVLAAAAPFLAVELGYRAFILCRQALAKPRPAGIFELYVVGESTATGEPYSSMAPLSGLVALQFDRRIAGRPIDVIEVARSGQSIYPQAAALKAALLSRNRSNPGAVLIYSGHNDRWDSFALPAIETFKEKVLYRSAALSDLLFWLEKRRAIPHIRTLGAWAYHLRRVIEMSRDAGLVPILATAASNESDMDPCLTTGSGHPPYADTVLAEGERLVSRRRYREAARYYREQIGLHPEMSAYLEYSLGRCWQAAGDFAQAKQAFVRAVDVRCPDNFGRASSSQNAFLRALAKEYGIPLVDTVAIFEAHSPHGITSYALFSDGLHPNLEGYRLLARGYAERISEAFHEPIARPLNSVNEVFAAFSLGKEQQALALVVSGRNLFSFAVKPVHPLVRLRAARGLPGSGAAGAGRLLGLAGPGPDRGRPAHGPALRRRQARLAGRAQALLREGV